MGVNIVWRIADSVTSSSNSQPISGTHQQAGATEQVISVNYPANTNATSLNCSFGNAGNNSGALQAIIMLASANTTIKTNNSTSPQDTINLTGGIPLEWDNSLTYVCPFNNSVSTMFVTCNTASLLQMKILQY